METNNRQFCLYVVLNLEFASMGAGRCAAQASHAANQFIDNNLIKPLLDGQKPNIDIMNWRSEANGFGTQIVKAATNRFELEALVKQMNDLGFISELVIDPEYVVTDGESFHIVPNVVTAAYVFGEKVKTSYHLYDIPLLLNTPFDLIQQFAKD